MGSDPKLSAALLILGVPLDAEIPPSETPETALSYGPMHPGPAPLNPEFEKWSRSFFERVNALCLVNHIKPTSSGDINWMGLAMHLLFDYEPRDKHAPRIKFKRTRGAKPKHSSPAAKAARLELAEIVAKHRVRNPRQSVSDIARNLAGKKNVPAFFREVKWETLRKHIERAEREAKREQEFQKALSVLFASPGLLTSYKPGTDFLKNLPGWSGTGLNLRPPPPSDK